MLFLITKSFAPLQEQQEEREELKSELQAELAETRASLNQQLAKLRSQLSEATTKLTTVQAETDRKDELVLQLRWPLPLWSSLRFPGVWSLHVKVT